MREILTSAPKKGSTMRRILALLAGIVSTPAMAQVSCESLSEYDRAASVNFRGIAQLPAIPGASECAVFEDDYNSFQCIWDLSDTASGEETYKELVASVQSCLRDVTVDTVKNDLPLKSTRMYTDSSVFYASLGTNSSERPPKILFSVEQR
jgi:hypothetical protein